MPLCFTRPHGTAELASTRQAELDGAGASTIELRADKMISAMGFTVGDADLPVSAFSGGWKMRIGLGKILLQEPQVRLHLIPGSGGRQLGCPDLP